MFVLELSRGLLSDAEMLEDIVQRFLAADLAAGDFAQLLQYHFQIFGDDVAAHSHFHRLQYSGEGILGTEKCLVVAGTRNDDVVHGNLRNISGFYQCLLQDETFSPVRALIKSGDSASVDSVSQE